MKERISFFTGINKIWLLLLPILLVMIIPSCTTRGMESVPQPPVAMKIDHEIEAHGHIRVDPYYWMRDRENPQLIDYLNAENKYLQQVMAHTENLQERLFEEMKGRIRQDDQSAPVFSNGYYYYSRFEISAEYPIYARREGSMNADEEILLDVNILAKPHPYYSVGSYDVSLDNRLLVFTADTIGRRQYTIMIKDLETGQYFNTGIQYAGGSVAWAADNATFFYNGIHPETLRYERILSYNFRDGQAPREVYYEPDETFYYMTVSRSKDNQYIMINSRSTLSTETWLLEANRPQGQFRVFQERTPNVIYDVYPHNGMFYILTNHNAVNFRLMIARAQGTQMQHWQQVIGHRPDVLIENIELFENHLLVQERSNALRHLRIIQMSTGNEHYLRFPEEAYTAHIGANMHMQTNILRFNYTSLTTPMSQFDYNMDTREQILVKQQEVLGDFDPQNYQTRRLFVEARDGKRVPLTLVYRKDISSDKPNPTLIYGYGSYGSSADPRFNSNILSLLDRGFIYAIAHVRGGQDLGRQWYEDGKLLSKRNTFNDFIDCAIYLINQNYTSPDRLFAIGGSAGGLLVGAVINERPELFKGVIAAVPFVDVVTTMLDETIPLTTAEYDEWGNPNIKEYYDYMLSYSPYDNIRAQNFPNLLVTSGLHDSQVQYWEPTKWVARLREYNQGDSVILLHTNMEAGHGGASGRFQRLREIALQYAFLLSKSVYN
jgi:oligopeptidase B